MTFVFIIALIHFSFFNTKSHLHLYKSYPKLPKTEKSERLLPFAEVKTRNSNAMLIPINILYVLRH